MLPENDPMNIQFKITLIPFLKIPASRKYIIIFKLIISLDYYLSLIRVNTRTASIDNHVRTKLVLCQ